MTSDINVGEITSAQTHDLRRRVLRSDEAAASVEWQGDDEGSTVHLGASIDGVTLGISTWLVMRDPIARDVRALQLRGMATDPAAIGRGIGRALLSAGLDRASQAGFERVWANARVTALGFYEAQGWIVTGPVFDTPATGLPHRHIHIDLV